MTSSPDEKEYCRVRRYEVTPALFPMMFTTGQKFEVTDGIPEGANFRGFAHCYERNTIMVFIEHESFDKVHASYVAPQGPPIQMRRIDEPIQTP